MIVSSVINTGATIAIASVIKTTNSLDLIFFFSDYLVHTRVVI